MYICKYDCLSVCLSTHLHCSSYNRQEDTVPPVPLNKCELFTAMTQTTLLDSLANTTRGCTACLFFCLNADVVN